MGFPSASAYTSNTPSADSYASSYAQRIAVPSGDFHDAARISSKIMCLLSDDLISMCK